MVIKLSKSARPEEAAAKDKSRYAIDSPWFDKGMSAVCATDGRKVVVIPVESDGEESGALPRDALKAFRKVAPKGRTAMDISADNGSVSYGGVSMMREELGTVPDVSAVIPAKDKGTYVDKGFQHVTAICLDAKMLFQLAKAMGTDQVRLQIVDSCVPIRVDPVMGGEGYGAIMPISGE